MPKLIGVTGTIGSGKSTVGKLLEQLQIPVIDTDKIVHHLLTADTPVRKDIIRAFGPSVVKEGSTGEIDRSRLGSIVFADGRLRQTLEEIVHPAVLAECRGMIERLGAVPVVAILVPLLFEAGLEAQYDEIWTVTCDDSTLRGRLQKRDGFSASEVESRLSAQLPQGEKAARADCLIDNSHSVEHTRAQIESLVARLKNG